MKGDFSRNTFDAKNHFSRVLLQQGRVTLDADPNEQSAILLHYLRTLARDLIGPCGGPTAELGFQVEVEPTQGGARHLSIGSGRYYVDGILVENESDCDYAAQPHFEADAENDPVLARLAQPQGDDVWLYLDVWERHVSWIEDDRVRESALGGPDTCTRAKVVWQVRGIPRGVLLETLKARKLALEKRIKNLEANDQRRNELEAELSKVDAALASLTPSEEEPALDCTAPLAILPGISDAQMVARVHAEQPSKSPCLVSPEARYRGAENQLYRVEVHRGSAQGVAPTFKWSRDNGSVATRWLNTNGNDLIVPSIRGFEPEVWVELSDESNELRGEPGLLVKLINVQDDRLTVDPLSIPAGKSIALPQGAVNPKVRRWDQSENEDITLVAGAVALTERTAKNPNWIALEDGIEVQFAAGGTYRSGDYWLIPARVATGSIEWPHTRDASGKIVWEPQPVHGVEHHFAPLGFITPGSDSVLSVAHCVCEFDPIGACPQAATLSQRRQRAVTRSERSERAPASRPAKPKADKPKP